MIVEDGWVVCPHCHKKQFPINKATTIICLLWVCKACKNPFTINIERGNPAGFSNLPPHKTIPIIPKEVKGIEAYRFE